MADLNRRAVNARRSLLGEFERSVLLASPPSEASSGAVVATDPVTWISAVTRILGSIYLYHRNIFPRRAFESANMERDGIENVPVLYETRSCSKAKGFVKIMDSVPLLLRQRKIAEISFVVAADGDMSDFAAEKFKVTYVYGEHTGVDAIVDIGQSRRLSTVGMTPDAFKGLVVNFEHMLKSLSRIPSGYGVNVTALVWDENDLSAESQEEFMRACGFSFVRDPLQQLKTPAIVLDHWASMGDADDVTMDVKLGSMFQSVSERGSLTESFDDLSRTYTY
ncbi:hypothetical protein QR680_009121 [Steinernema hermaphroditum]|uniref:HORMA domain-containing protein n=1 Tax=Steinernema hermaphroditum TaxID=289476 RepID=A0AA39M9B5_9BILA|nr:hypothetical protein QR680_009121 [Steinernema hermaphroditum]